MTPIHLKDETVLKMDMMFMRIMSVFLGICVYVLAFFMDNQEVGAMFALVLTGILAQMAQTYRAYARELSFIEFYKKADKRREEMLCQE